MSKTLLHELFCSFLKSSETFSVSLTGENSLLLNNKNSFQKTNRIN